MDEFSVRPDVGAFARDVEEMRGILESGLGTGADRAGRLIESGLARAIRSGKFGFDDLRSTALSTLNQIAAATVRSGLSSLLGGGSGGGLVSLGSAVVGALTGLPGRATGGPVSPGRAYVVGERGPELFVPTASGSVSATGGGGREVRVSININAPADAAPAMLARSSRQVARAVRAALSEE
jgi:phage-related minor tail protein